MEKLNDFSLFDMSASVLGSFLGGFTYPWQALDKLNAEICRIIPLLGSDYIELKTGVFAHKTAEIYPSALILPPAVICENAVIRHSAFIRGSAVIGRGAVVGNSTEIKNAVLFDGAKAPHFNYVGDSIVGKNAHLSAGVITCNVRADEMPVKVVLNGKTYDTGRKKVGSFIGDNAEIGCGSALNPGSVIGRRSRIYPLSSVRGEIFEDCIYKSCSEIVKIVIPDGRGSYDEVFRYGRFSGENGGEN